MTNLISNSRNLINNQSILILHPKKYIRFFRVKEESNVSLISKSKIKRQRKLVYYPKVK